MIDIRLDRFTLLAVWGMLVSANFMMSADRKNIKIYLLGGQSNMVGQADAVNLVPPLSEPYAGVKVWNNLSGTWMPLSANGRGRFGPEIGFGHAMAKAFPFADIRLVKYASNGTALYDDWDPETKGPEYVAFMKAVHSALADLAADGLDFEIAGMLWLQGESDALEGMAESYQERLWRFIRHLRTEFSADGMPFIIARIRDHFGGETGQAKIVRDAQVELAESAERIEWFDTDDLSLLDPGHYDADGLIEVGNRFAQKIIDLGYKSKSEK